MRYNARLVCIAAAAISSGLTTPALAQNRAEATAEVLLESDLGEVRSSDPFRLTEAELIELAGDNPTYRSYPVPEVLAWEKTLRTGLADGSLDEAATKLYQ